MLKCSYLDELRLQMLNDVGYKTVEKPELTGGK
jgi:hypothetical protein